MQNENEKSKLMAEYKMLSKQYQSMVVDEKGELRFKVPDAATQVRERMWAIVDKVLEIENKEKKNV